MDTQVTIHLNEKLGVKKDQINKTFRTSIDAFDDMGNVLFTQAENNVVLAGSLMTLEKLLNVRSSLEVDSLNNIMGINNNYTPVSGPLPQNDYICLWGIGIGGAGDSIGSVRDVKFYEREVGSNGNSAEMVPFRVTDTPLTGTDAEMYYFSKELTGGKRGYFLKAFESAPVIKPLWHDGAEGEDGSEVTADVFNTNRTENIEVFAEIILKLTKKDVREYFQMLNQIERCHINTISLCCGIKKEIAPGVFDYTDVKMITKLNFGNELLANKEITFRYRIYTN